MNLPQENDLREHIRIELVTEFELAAELLRLGIGLFEKDFAINSENVPGYDELWLCLGIIAKSCKQYRAIYGIVELGLSDVANSNCRMLFETSLAAQFLMRPEINLRRGKKAVPEIPGYPLTTEFRTKLYLANDALSTAKVLREMAKDGGLGTADDAELVRRAQHHAQQQCNLIGPDWTQRLRVSGSFSGLKIFDLTESFDRLFVYNGLYRSASASVHGADARRSMNLEIEDSGEISFRFPIRSDGVADSLMWASHAFLDVLQITSLRFDLGLEASTQSMRLRVQRMKNG